MSSIFSCWFNKKKSKGEEIHLPYESYNNRPSIYVADGSNMKGAFNRSKNVKAQHNRHRVERAPEPTQSPVYVERHSIGSEPGRKIRSYPVSPVRTSRTSEDRGYVSDQQARPIIVERKSIPYRKNSAVVLVANVPHRASLNRTAANVVQRSSTAPRPEQTSESFPFQIPENAVPRRSSLFYGVKYDDYIANQRLSAEKPIESYAIPSTSKDIPSSPPVRVEYHDQENIQKPKKSVSINVNNAETFGDDNSMIEPVRTTVVRFRPHSSGSFQRRDSVKLMPVRADEVEHPPTNPGKYIHDMPVKHEKQHAILTTKDGKILQPLKSDKIGRASVLKAEREARRSVASATIEYTPKNPQVEELNVITVPEESTRRSVLRTSPRQSILRRESVDRNSLSRRYSNAQEENIEEIIQHPVPFNKPNTAEVYAVPVIPSRGRSRSILQQSVKSLTSKKYEEPVVSKKNIRYSMTTDVFSTHVQRKSISKSPQNYVNMERGQPMLVSEILNPITSIFVSDLKDPVPKDPISKPSEPNVWVRPKSPTVQRQSVIKQTRKSISRVQPVYNEPKQKVYVQRRRSSIYDESSSSDEDYRGNTKKRRPTDRKNSPYYQQQRVYAAHIKDVPFPTAMSQNGKNPPFKKKGRQSTERCDLNCGESVKGEVVHEKSDPGFQEASIDDMDLVCYPSERFLQNTALDTESSSKLRWRIIIKRGDEK